MHKKGARLCKNLLQPLADVVSINRRQNIRKRELVQLSYCENWAPWSWATPTAPIVGGQDQDKVMFMYLKGNTVRHLTV